MMFSHVIRIEASSFELFDQPETRFVIFAERHIALIEMIEHADLHHSVPCDSCCCDSGEANVVHAQPITMCN